MKRCLTLLLGLAGFNLIAADAPVPLFRPVTIDTNIQIGYGLAVADVNGDKKPDIVLADAKQIVWYENPSWKKHVMVENLTPQDHVCIAARDIDGDGKAEVAVGAGWNPGDTVNSGAVFYLAPGEDRTARWTPIKLPHEPTVHRMRWARQADGRFALVVLPLHGKGNKGGEGAGVKMQAYFKPTNPKDPWQIVTLNEAHHMTHNLDPVQWDADGAEELLLASREGIALLESTAKGADEVKISDAQTGGAGEVRLGKGKGGNRFLVAVEPMHGNQLAAYTPGENGALWKRQELTGDLKEGHALACGDLLGQGHDQVVVGWRGRNGTGATGIRLFQFAEGASGPWTSAVIDGNDMACEDLMLADLDGDGRLEIIAAGRATKNVKIYYNNNPK